MAGRPKAKRAAEAKRFEDIPTVGKATAGDFELLGLKGPADLKDADPVDLYVRLCEKTGVRHDPCVLDAFMAAVDFMRGGKARPWWDFTAKRKAMQASGKAPR